MIVKVYNQNGIIKITKIIETNNCERTIFGNLQDGEVAEIEVDFHTSIKAKKKRE